MKYAMDADMQPNQIVFPHQGNIAAVYTMVKAIPHDGRLCEQRNPRDHEGGKATRNPRRDGKLCREPTDRGFADKLGAYAFLLISY